MEHHTNPPQQTDSAASPEHKAATEKKQMATIINVFAFIMGFLDVQLVFVILLKVVGIPWVVNLFLILEIIAIGILLKKIYFAKWLRALFWGNIIAAIIDLIAFFAVTSAILGAIGSISR